MGMSSEALSATRNMSQFFVGGGGKPVLILNLFVPDFLFLFLRGYYT